MPLGDRGCLAREPHLVRRLLQLAQLLEAPPLELRVAASNRDCYAQGALLAAKWVLGKQAGLYSMNDVLGL